MILLGICCQMWRWLVKMARRSFKLVKDLEKNFESASHGSACFICQEDLKDKLVCLLNSNHQVEHKNNIQTMLTIPGGLKM